MEDFNSKAVGIRLGKIRIEKGLSQEQVAAELDVSRETYNTIEAGRRKLKDFEICKLAELFETTTDYILRDVQTENVSLSVATGLSDSAINYLQTLKQNMFVPFEPYPPEGLKNLRVNRLLNTILSHDGDTLLSALSDYIFADFSHAYPMHGDSLIYEEMDGVSFSTKYGNASVSGEESNGRTFLVSDGTVTVSTDVFRFAMLKDIEMKIEKLRAIANEKDAEPKKRVRGTNKS